MRSKAISTLLVIISIFTLFTSCQKENSESSADEQIVSKIKIWLDDQKVGMKPFKASNIDLLKESLVFSALTIEQLNENEQIVIIPITDNFKQLKINEKKSIPNLIIFMNSLGVVKEGNVILYIPEDSDPIRKLPENSFQNLLNSGVFTCNGKFQFLSVAGHFEYEIGNKNGTRSIGVAKATKKSANERVNSICIDWYLVTTYHYADGTTSTTYEYLGTTCSEECGDGSYQSLCPDGSFGGGGGNNDLNIEEDVARLYRSYVSLDVYPINMAYGGGMCKTNQTMYARMFQNRPERDRIIDCWLQNSQVVGNSQSLTSTIPDYKVTGLGTQNISIKTTGIIHFPDQSTIPFEHTQPFNIGMTGWIAL